MQLSGKYTFETDQETLWKVLMDPDAIAEALPGVDELIPIEGEADAWRADVKLQIATLGGSYSGVIRMSEQNPEAKVYRLTVEGEGQLSIIQGTALISLHEDDIDPNDTLLKWDAEANISGKLAGVGQRLIGATANMMAKRFFKALSKQLPSDDE